MLKKIWKIFVSLTLFFFIFTILVVLIFRFLPIPTSSFMLQQRITNLIDGNFNSINYDWVNYNEISNSAKLAVIAAEDQKFFDHYGFDLNQLKKRLREIKEVK